MSAMPAMHPMATAPMMALMMVPMMLPSVAPTLWRCYTSLAAVGTARAAGATMLIGAGHASVWAAVGYALLALSRWLSPGGVASPTTHGAVAAWPAGAIILSAGLLQRSRWKSAQLARCRAPFAGELPRSAAAVWREGYRLGTRCVLSCAAPTAVLFVCGWMDSRAMLAITGAITAERLAPCGARIARLTGAVAIGAGLTVCARAFELAR